MRLFSPETAPQFQLTDSYGNIVKLKSGKRTLLAFFRDTNCPFCNLRIFQLTQHYQNLAAEGLEIIAFFSSTEEEVSKFVSTRPRPFTVVADPENIAYKAYGIERSLVRSTYSVFRHFYSWILGIKILGLDGFKKNLQNPSDIMPADFLINEHGDIVETYYGSDASDHIPFERIHHFLRKNLS